MNLPDLQEFLNQNEIPKIKKNPKTFLDIAKQPHYENVLSNIYAFFFNVKEEHKLKDLFIKSLIDCINEQTTEKDFSEFENFYIETEYYTKGIGKTKKAGRIDLLLYNDEQAIIIENKVNHHLDNDLDDYWKSVELDTSNTKSKIGILLTLKPISETQYSYFEHHKEYINITHLQLMQKVMKNSGSYLNEAVDKYILFLKDLNQNIINLSNYMKKDTLSFYYKNIQVLNDIAKIKFSVRDYLKKEIEETCEALNMNLTLNKSRGDLEKRLRYYVSQENPNLMITVIFNELLTTSKKLWLIIDLKYNTLENKEIYKNLIDNSEYKTIIDRSFMTNTNKTWAHIAAKEYILSEDDIEEIANFIATKLKDDKFLSLFEELETVLKNNKA